MTTAPARLIYLGNGLVVPADDCSAIKALLDERLKAYNDAMTGGQVRSIQDSDTSRVEYNSPNMDRLMKDIQLLQAQYAACLGQTVSPAMTKPINFIF